MPYAERTEGTPPYSYIERLADGAVIPKDEANSDFRDYLAWEEAGRPEVWPPAALS